MTDKRYELTRRKILATAGAVGAAGAGAGLGTSAFFSDEENFANNTMIAGELDLKVDWEEHYSYPQDYDGFDTDPTDGLDVVRSESEKKTGTTYVGLPDPNDPVVWVDENDLDTYMSNTAIEAFPDPDNDGEQEIDGTGDSDVDDGFEYEPCDDGADLPDDLGTFAPSDDSVARTKNADTTNDDGEREPLISLDDVKPGDHGEITFSFHLCDNPGHVWLQAANVNQSENGITESEAADPDEDEDESRKPGTDSSADRPELAEKIQTVWWYDDGDNVIDDETETVFHRGTLKSDLAALSARPIPLDGDPSTDFDEFAGDPASDDRECFAAEDDDEEPVAHYIGFGWWLPLNHGNEIQSDSVSFDLGFYTEQCRHNDGVGPATGLVGYWPLDSVDDRIAVDLSGNGNDGTIEGDVSSDDGQVAGAGSFDGDGDYIAASGAYASTPVSIAAWFRVDGPGTLNPRIVGTDDASFRLLLDGGYKDGDKSISFDVLNGGPQTDSPSSVDDGDWHHVVATYDGSTARLYLDNSEVDSALSSTTITNSNLWIGSKNGSADFFEGAIDDVRVYNRALSASEVKAIYNATK